ncbi:metallophosphoesterase [Aureibaculum sp. A20]|uniref:Metallophosphoesterase n=1 Tax=Aureibaculum flavum TaxID=2795986 RepID=A0ABS0WNV6_9FLAO|nr:metallophosphoesterase [Aureibaculum flavum]MBJ2173649.1 metallophosphoesterase [Aureibaculum flavum]
MIDLIGDIHGYADELKELLQKLGYSKQNNYYAHPNRKVLFVGDYIDRGPKIRETLEIVKQMVDNKSAIALMGNHEYNALCFHFLESEGGHLRKHSIKNITQHYETLKQFQNRQKEYEEYLEWFKSLPLFYETETFRAVHACWDSESINFLKTELKNNCLTDVLICQSIKKGTKLNEAIELILKGKEIRLPNGLCFFDKDGNKRGGIRIKWWEDPKEITYKEISVKPLSVLPNIRIDLSTLNNAEYYLRNEKPVFFGHYWLEGKPSLYKNNICCLDYSIANKKIDGHLVAYSHDNEQKLEINKLTFVINSTIT